MTTSNSNHSKKNNPTFLEKLQQCIEDKSIVEIVTDTNTITGTLTVVGKDFVGISSAAERKASQISVGQDGKKETQEYVEVYYLETFIKFKEIRAVSRVLNKTYK